MGRFLNSVKNKPKVGYKKSQFNWKFVFVFQGYQPMAPQPLQHATPQPPQPQTPEPPQPVQKGPIPADHQILQEVFDGLKNRCLSASNHPVSFI